MKNPWRTALRRLMRLCTSVRTSVATAVSDRGDDEPQWTPTIVKTENWTHTSVLIHVPVHVLHLDPNRSIEESFFDDLAHEIGHCIAAPLSNRLRKNFGDPDEYEEIKANLIRDYLRYRLGPVDRMIWRRDTRPSKRWFVSVGQPQADLCIDQGLVHLLPRDTHENNRQ